MFNKRLRLAAAASVVIVGIAACGGGEPSDGDAAATPSELNVTLAVTPFANVIRENVAEFTEATGVDVNISVVGTEQLTDQYKVQLEGDTSEIDVMMYQPPQDQALFVSNGWVASLSDRISTSSDAFDWDDFQAPTREAVSIDGEVYGVPVMTERQIIFYRPDVLEAAGLEVPTTLEELEATVAAVHDPENGFFGITGRGARAAAVTQFSSYLYSFGSDFDEDGVATIATPEAIAAYEYYGGLLREYGPPGTTGMTWVEASAIFAQGNAAFYIEMDSAAYVFEDEEQSVVSDSFAVAPFPAGPAGARPYNVTPWAIGIPESTNNKDLAWQFIEWATSKEMMVEVMVEESGPSPRDSSWEDSAVVAEFDPALIEIAKLYSEIGVGHDRPQVIQVGEAREIIGSPIVVAIDGGDVEAAAKAAAEQYQQLLDQQP